jgi:uncharacterized membrane protein
MKKVFFSILCLSVVISSAFLFSGCGKTDITTVLTIPSFTFTVPAQAAGTSEKTWYNGVINTNIQTCVKNAGGQMANLKSIKMKTCQCNFTSGTNVNTSDNSTIYTVNSNLTQISMAVKNPIAHDNSSVIFYDAQTSNELVDVLKNDTYRVIITGHNSVDRPTCTMTCAMTFDVIIGAN